MVAKSKPTESAAQRDPVTGEMTIWASNQWPHILRGIVAGMLGLAERSVRVITPDVGGGFGCKAEVYPEDVLVPFATARLGRPVKWTSVEATLTEHTCGPQPRSHPTGYGRYRAA